MTKVAARYAKSLLGLAQEQNATEAINNDMMLVIDTIRANRQLAALLKNPTVKSDKKHKILTEIFGNKINKVSMAFLDQIVRKHRDPYLQEIAQEFTSLYKESKGIKIAVITSANGLDDKLRKEVYELLKKSTNSEIELIEEVNKQLIGGFILRIGDKQYDASIANKLNQFNKALISTAYARVN